MKLLSKPISILIISDITLYGNEDTHAIICWTDVLFFPLSDKLKTGLDVLRRAREQFAGVSDSCEDFSILFVCHFMSETSQIASFGTQPTDSSNGLFQSEVRRVRIEA